MPASPKAGSSNQPNKMICDSVSPLLIAGLDDGQLICIDTTKYEICAQIPACHNGEGISDLSLDGQRKQEVITSGHDGRIAVWDVRRALSKGEIVEIKPGLNEQVHQKKHEEGALCVSMLNDLPMCVTGGADGLVKVFDVSNPETEKQLLDDK